MGEAPFKVKHLSDLPSNFPSDLPSNFPSNLLPSLPSKFQGLEKNSSFQEAMELMETSHKSLFITGKAGTGKSTLLQYFRYQTKKRLAVLAPTGVAALNVQGQTLHRFFNFPVDVTPEKVHLGKIRIRNSLLYKSLQVLLIDEVSMLRADLLDCVDIFLQKYGPSLQANKPFGGVQMIFIGDLYQLSPVVTSQERGLFTNHYSSPYFFSAEVFTKKNFQMKTLELKKVYRQKNSAFIDILNKVRNNTVSKEDLHCLNSRYLPYFENDFKDPKNFYVYLTGTNKRADEINHKHLNALSDSSHHFKAGITGDFDKNIFPNHQDLELKKNAQVMLLNNDSKQRWINGSVGTIECFKKGDTPEKDEIYVRLRKDNGKSFVQVERFTWEVFRFVFSEEKQAIVSKLIGSFTQFPLRLAWAITIHKSQGKTFDRVFIDIGKRAFAPGQMYVALSRCISLEGIVLKTPLQKHHIFTDPRIFKFLNS